MIPVAITGLGVVSPFGAGVPAFFDGLVSGRTAVRPIASFDASTFPVGHAAEVPMPRLEPEGVARLAGLDAHAPAFREAWKRGAFRDRKAAWALAAARESWTSAGLAPDTAAPICLGLGLEQALLEDFAPLFREGRIQWPLDAEALLPEVRYRTPVDQALRLLRELMGLKGPSTLHLSACAAGALAVAQGASLVARGQAPRVLCGAADAMINPLGLGGMIRLGAASPRDTPEACRPFDRRRDGLVLGEGAALFLLEAGPEALARGARVLAWVRGWGGSQDGYRVTAPRPDGSAAARAMERALDRAGLAPEALDYLNAHGTGTPLNDTAEAEAIHRALGPRAPQVPLSSIKGAVGHLMAAAGALELAACLLPFQRGVVPGTANHGERDAAIALNVLGPGVHALPVRYALSNSFGFGGQNASLVLEAP